MSYGSIVINVSTSAYALPVKNAMVMVDGQSYLSDENGKVYVTGIQAPPKELSLDVNYTGIPYSTINVKVTKEGYQDYEVIDVQIFADLEAILQTDLLPISERIIEDEPYIVYKHSLVSNGKTSCAPRNLDADFGTYVLSYPIIPKYITVHLGRPSDSSRNVTVTFKDYLKNVASSEIYPTWPKESLRANIYCQISLVLNRVFTEWYRSKGYSYDITNSTSFDQYYVHGRNIYDSVSVIVDDIFNEYIRKDGKIEPFYAEYCDGRQVWCPGLKQWGTVTLAQQGKNSFEILEYYYGTQIGIVTTNRIEGVSGSYPGFSMRVGTRGDSVAKIQNQLNRIAVNYPSITPIYPVDGIYGPKTEESVKVFQRQFDLRADGIVGNATWYKVSYIYVAVKKLAELGSEGIEDRLIYEYPGQTIRQGAKNVYVQEVQFFIQKMGLFTTKLPFVKIDGYYGSGTKASVISFQKLARISADGVVGQTTWKYLVEGFKETLDTKPPLANSIGNYPGTAIRVGDRGNDVKTIQASLNYINTNNGNLTTLTVDGIFGSGTERTVKTFQESKGLVVDGIVGRATWSALNDNVSQILANPVTANVLNYELQEVIYDAYTNLMYDTTVNKNNV